MKTRLELKGESDWATYSRIYDDYYGAYRDDVEYLTSRWQPNWRSVVEVGAGTGRLIPFFKRQEVSRYVGLDTCPEMLEIASGKATPDGYQLVEGDLLDHDLIGKFDLFVYAFNTANYVLKAAELERHLRICSGHLREGGSVFFDLYVPFAISRGEDDSKYRMRERRQSAGRVLELCDRRAYDPVTRVERRNQNSCEMEGSVLRAEFNIETWRRYYSPEEIQRLASDAGLGRAHVEEYGTGYVEGYYIFLS
jgi:SAM-dependent methyltransferase